MSFPTFDIKHVRGLSYKALGLGKEAFGTLLGNHNLAEEGQAQQDRGAAELKALRAEVKGEVKSAAARTEAKVSQTRQRVAQKVKETTKA